MNRHDEIKNAYRSLGKEATFYDGKITCSTLPGKAVCGAARRAIRGLSTGTDAAAVKYSKIIDGMQLYTPEQLKALLEEVGFTEVKLRQASDKPWIAVLGRKPKEERMV